MIVFAPFFSAFLTIQAQTSSSQPEQSVSVVAQEAIKALPNDESTERVIDASREVTIDSSDLNIGQKLLLYGYMWPTFVHQLPFVTIYEASHLFTARALGIQATLHLRPAFMKRDGNTIPSGAHVELADDCCVLLKGALIIAAPYVVQLLVVDRGIELLYRHEHIRIGSNLDKYLQTSLLLNSSSGIDNSIPGGDLNYLAKLIPAPKFIRKIWLREIVVALGFNYLYAKSYNRIMDARGRYQPDFTFYITRRF